MRTPRGNPIWTKWAEGRVGIPELRAGLKAAMRRRDCKAASQYFVVLAAASGVNAAQGGTAGEWEARRLTSSFKRMAKVCAR